MVTHTLQGYKLPTLQLLMCASPADTGQVPSYGAALTRIFDTLGGIPAHPDRDFDRLARIICCALCEITELLAMNNLVCFPSSSMFGHRSVPVDFPSDRCSEPTYQPCIHVAIDPCFCVIAACFRPR